MLNFVIISLAKLFSKLIQAFNLGNGSTWPGHIALGLNPQFIAELIHFSKLKIILIAGTNGKTTISSMIRAVLEANGKTVIQNESGANLLNGIASSLILNTNSQGNLPQNYAIFEVDENTLPLILKEIIPDYLVLNNLFRDQLDRYGEVDAIARKWKESIQKLPPKTTLILNADDPQIAYLGENIDAKTVFFGLGSNAQQKDNTDPDHSADSLYCPGCGKKLIYKKIIFSHLGDWNCSSCGFKKPKPTLTDFPFFPLFGTYNKYNTLASAVLLSNLGLSENQIATGLKQFKPAFGRQEKIAYEGKQVQIFLSKNPTGFNESMRTVTELKAKTVVFVLNDGVADGKDVSWIWDIDMEKYNFENIVISGDRVYDMALRVKYAVNYQNQKSKVKTIDHLQEAIKKGIELIGEKETLYILPTYTAMLEVRKILTGRKIL